MANLQLFQREGQQLRGLLIDGEPWFVAADVCKALGIKDTSDAVERLDNDEKGAVSIPTPGGQQEMLGVNEAGLYALIMGSRKPQAKPFQRWVTHEVLPAIRKTGTYSRQLTPAELLLVQAQQLVDMERRQQEQDQRLRLLEARTAPTQGEYFTVMGWGNLIGKSYTAPQAAALSRKCGTMSSQIGATVGKVADPRYGTVKTYHKDVLAAICGGEVAHV